MSALGRARDAAVWFGIGRGVSVLAFLLGRRSKKDEWLRRAMADFDSVIRFQNGDGSRGCCIVFERGRARALASPPRPPDFTLTLYHPERLRFKGPEAAVDVMITNSIGQVGNLYHLYRFGFIASLLARRARSLSDEVYD